MLFVKNYEWYCFTSGLLVFLEALQRLDLVTCLKELLEIVKRRVREKKKKTHYTEGLCSSKSLYMHIENVQLVSITIQLKFTILFQMLLYVECYENVYT
jgi:hypothetical protein